MEMITQRNGRITTDSMDDTTYVYLPHLWFHTRVTWLMTWTEALSLPPAGNFNMVGRMA